MAISEEILSDAKIGSTELGRTEQTKASVNVAQAERWASAIGGGALAVYGLSRGNLKGIALALLGGALVQRGLTGHCTLYDAMGYTTTSEDSPRSENVSVRGGRGMKVEKSVTVNRDHGELYRFWRNFENLPRFMNHLESVHVTGNNRSHWVAKAPAGRTVEWDAEVYNEKENEMIAWRSLEGSDVDSAGSVHFTPGPVPTSTVVRVVLKYDPPGGAVGALVAKLFGENPEQQIEDDLLRFKKVMEAGEIASIRDQESSHRATAGR